MSHKRLGDFTTDSRVLLLTAMAAVAGSISTVVAVALLRLINLITNAAFFARFSWEAATPPTHHPGAIVILVPAVGGLIIGLMARYGSEKIRGHGIPEALEAILIGQSRISLKVALLKPLSSAISIGTGGPFGAEGPIIMTGGAFGSLFAQLFHLSAAERKTLLVAGAAAGMAAIFATPVAAVFLAVELLLFEWKPRSLIPVTCASSVAAVLRIPLLGQGPIFPVVSHSPLTAAGIGYAVGVGVIAGFASGALTGLVYAFEDLFIKAPVHWMWWPAIGGTVVGIAGMFEPRVLGIGYETIHALLQGELVSRVAVVLLAAKALAWSFALGSGTSGGVLAPLLMMGAALGVLESAWIPLGSVGVWATLSMAAMMGGTMRSPLTALVFTLELTRDFNLMPALLVTCVAAQAVTVLWLRRSILTEKIARRGLHLTREYGVDPFQLHRVREIMQTQMKTVRADTRWRDAVSALNGTWNAPVVDAEGKLAGIVTQSDVLRLLENNPEESKSIGDLATLKLVVAYPEETVSDAVGKMLLHDIGRLPVVDPETGQRLLGLIDRATVMVARRQWHREEHIREHGWLGRFRARREQVPNA